MSLDYQILSGDKGRVLNVDVRNEVVNVMLPAPVLGFVITVKDLYGNSANNPITIIRNGSENIDSSPNDLVINVNFDSVTLISDGTDWFRMSNFAGLSMTQGLGLFGGGFTGSQSNVIDYVNIAVKSNATDFGDLTVARNSLAACSNSTRGIWAGGSTGTQSNVIDYVTIATTGNATDFGDTTITRLSLAGVSNQTHGLFGGGNISGIIYNTIDYVVIATTSNATDFGDLTAIGRAGASAFASSTRGIWANGYDDVAPYVNIIDYVTIATTGNATDFGDSTLARYFSTGCSNNIRGVSAGGTDGTIRNIVDYVTIATTGNAVDFGDLTIARQGTGACASNVRGLFGGGSTGSHTNIIDFILFSTLGNAADFGDLSVTRSFLAACSNVHGGL